MVHLHLHTEYSMLDSIIRIDRLMERATELKMPAIALTDHGSLFGGFEFYAAAKKVKIHPILGSELYVAGRGRRERTKENPIHHLTVLVQNSDGYRNLCRLLTLAHEEGFYYKPRVDHELLEQYRSGLIVLSGCTNSPISQAILSGDRERAEELAHWYADRFEDRFFFEIQRNGGPQQDRLNQVLIELSRSMGIPLVATNDCHYLNREDAGAQDVFMCIGMQKTNKDTDRLRFPSDQFYLRSDEEMRALFSDCPAAVDETHRVAELCTFQFETGIYKIPTFEPPDGQDLNGAIRTEAEAGLELRMEEIRERHPEWSAADWTERKRQYRERFEIELKIIQEMSFSGYFLIVSDFIRWAKREGIPVGPGRGSGAGSLVAYCLSITDIDPIEYTLLFERFLNVERISMPDFDVDFCIENRGRVIEYVTAKYNRDRERPQVAQIITYGRMKARAVIRDVGRVLGMPYSDVDSVAKLVPNQLNITLKEAFELEPRLSELRTQNGKIDELLSIAERLEGLVRHASIHAAGVVIADQPLDQYLPLYRGSEREVVTQFDMKAVEKIGLLKFDFLGLRNLTVIAEAIRYVERTTGERVDIRLIPMNDPKVFELLGEGDTLGVFQFESSGMRDVLRRLKPKSFEDIIAVGALYRPGPIEGGMIDDFIKRRHGKTAVVYEHPALEAILKETYGVIVYQEQVMKIASVLANYSLGEADLLRRAMGKKIAEEMQPHEKRFVEGAMANGIARATAQKIFNLMAEFANYGFNKSHAAAYGMISYQTAYLKAHYPKEFMAALMTSELENTEKMVLFIQNCVERGIPVLPPSVNESDYAFSVCGNAVRFGLGAVKNVGRQAIELVLTERESGGAFKSLFDFARRVDLKKVGRRAVEALIRSGVFDFTDLKRAQMYAILDPLLEYNTKALSERSTGQTTLFSRREIPMEIKVPEIEEWPERVRLSDEKTLVGYYISGHPLRGAESLVRLIPHRAISELEGIKEGSVVTLVVVPVKWKELRTKKGDRMAFVTVEDLSGSCETILFSDVFLGVADRLPDIEPFVFTGSIGHEDDGSIRLIAKSMVPLRKRLQDPEARLCFQMPVEMMTDATRVGRLFELCRHSPGPTRIRFEFLQGEDRIVLGTESIQVALSEPFLAEARSIVDPALVVLQ